MMKPLLLLTTIFLFAFTTSCKTDTKKALLEELQIKNINQTNHYFLDGKAYTGNVVSNQQKNGFIVHFFVNNGLIDGLYSKNKIDNQPLTQANYKNGILHGEHIEFYDNGLVREKKYYKQGFLDGQRQYFWPNGMIKEKNEFRGGKLVHNTTFYFSNGKLRKKIYFNEKGKKDSLWLEYHSNGKAKDCTFYNNGLILKTKQFNKNGNTIN